MQRPPRLTGWSGLPSSFTTRPSRFRARTPHPAGHSRHTVAKNEATPGTICSFGTTSGRIVSVAWPQPPVAAAAPVPATILKKSRRFMGAGASVVTRDAVERGVGIPRGVLLAVTVDTPAHAQRRRRHAKARHIQKVVRDRGTRLGRDGRHRLDGAMTGLASHAELDVGFVREVRVLGQLEHAHPRNRLAFRA